jgi:hypothetical protein
MHVTTGNLFEASVGLSVYHLTVARQRRQRLHVTTGNLFEASVGLSVYPLTVAGKSR